MDNHNNQEYFRSASNDSTTYMMMPPPKRGDAPSKLWFAMVVMVVVVLQIASTTGLFVFFNMSIAQTKNQGVTEELKCLSFLNTIEEQFTTMSQEKAKDLLQLLSSTPCLELAEGIKSYISKVTENAIRKHTLQEARNLPRRFNTSGSKVVSTVIQRPSAHLTLRDNGPQTQGSSNQSPQSDLHQSCRHPINAWDSRSFGAHVHNMSLNEGRLRVPQDGRYYLYSQVYFRYPSPSDQERTTSHQLVQCLYKKTSYLRPIQLLKGVGTKCWAADAEYALHSVYQGGLFELRAGDEIFISVSSPSMVYADETSSYFGAFRLDL
ncbi:TNF superfamily member 10, like [Amia ocellicauda]|uniref:TNF superfamily member 10, like n=1 Tax=Amia ocellicauda TaxID=2972642 RepID=UPI003463EC84